MNWVAVMPFKGGSGRKSRLGGVLDETQRADLSIAMALKVLGCLADCRAVDDILLLAPERPDWASVGWRRDEGGGLNAELSRLRDDLATADIVILHADLPLIEFADVDALLNGGADAAIAPDRHRLGTNALALRGGLPFEFAFGPCSFARHRAQAPHVAIVDRLGLRLDVDTPNDLEAARRAGFRPPISATPCPGVTLMGGR